MIKINLTPVEELENPYWWVLDVAVVAVVAIFAFIAADLLLEGDRSRITELRGDRDKYQQSYDELQSDLGRFDNLKTNIAELNTKLETLKQISGASKAKRYQPVIVLEHLQNLKPEGSWFNSIRIGGGEGTNTFELAGSSFDNVLVAEFMTSMQATQSQEVDPTDLRTQIFFSRVNLIRTARGQDDAFADLGEVQRFEFSGRIGERGGGGEIQMPGGPGELPDVPEMPEELPEGAPNASVQPTKRIEVTF